MMVLKASKLFSNTNPIAFASANPQLLQLGGTSTSDNWFYPQITDSGSGANITSLNKLGASTTRTVEMAQGNKQSRFVAWTFMDAEQRRHWAQTRWTK